VTEIEIRDPDPDDSEAAAGAPQDAEDDVPESPYRNLLVPLVVVPALIVMVVVGIFALFGAIAGAPPTPEENIETLLHGGRNERDQAAFGLMRQVLDQVGANPESGVISWEIDPALEGAILKAWEDLSAAEMESYEDVPITLALTVLVAKLGNPAGVGRLAELTRLPQSVDPDGEGRFLAAASLGGLNVDGTLEEGQAVVARGALLALLDAPDAGLRQAAAIGLQSLPGEGVLPALRGLLADRAVELRLQAALSLAQLGDNSGEAVLLEMIARAPYEEERTRDRKKWSKEVLISESRLQALGGLAKLGQLPSREVLQSLVDDDSDGELRALAMELLGD
jgi:hypothetical protein